MSFDGVVQTRYLHPAFTSLNKVSPEVFEAGDDVVWINGFRIDRATGTISIPPTPMTAYQDGHETMTFDTDWALVAVREPRIDIPNIYRVLSIHPAPPHEPA